MAVVAGAIAGSISLVGFGIDSFIEVTSGSVLLWRMSVDADVQRRERNERRALKIVGACFLALAAYISYESATDLWSKKAPEHSIPGIVLACVSLIVMPLLSRAKRNVGSALGSAAMHADAKQTEFCTYLSGILLLGLLLNTSLRSMVGPILSRGLDHGSDHRERRNRRTTGTGVRRWVRLKINAIPDVGGWPRLSK